MEEVRKGEQGPQERYWRRKQEAKHEKEIQRLKNVKSKPRNRDKEIKRVAEKN